MITSVIFDLNGTILSDEDEYGLAFKRVLEKLGALVKEDYPQIPGIGVSENWPYLIKKYNLKTEKDISELGDLTQEEYYNLLDRVTLRLGFEELIKELKSKNLKTAIATSNSAKTLEKVLIKFDIAKYFDALTTGDEVKKNKPDPEIFAKTAGKLNSEPLDCVVFEDSQAGVTAAKLINMKVVGVLRVNNKKDLRGADRMVTNFTEINFLDIINL